MNHNKLSMETWLQLCKKKPFETKVETFSPKKFF